MEWYHFKNYLVPVPRNKEGPRRSFQEQILLFVTNQSINYTDQLLTLNFTSYVKSFVQLKYIGIDFPSFYFQRYVHDIALSPEEYDDILKNTPLINENLSNINKQKAFIIVILLYCQNNVHIHDDDTTRYILHDLCTRLSHQDYGQTIRYIFDKILKHTKSFCCESGQDLLLTFDDDGLSPCQHLSDTVDLKYRQMVTPQWSPLSHHYLPQSVRQTVETVLTLNLMDGNVWVIMPRELVFKIISVTVDI